MNAADELVAGFENPPLDSQRFFRELMEAWARPGRIAPTECAVEAPSSLDIASAAVGLTLADQDSPVWLSAHCVPSTTWFRFHCGCPITEQSDTAMFVFAKAGEIGDLSIFNLGDAVTPDKGATLILQVSSLTDGAPIRLEGPGIQNQTVVHPSGVPTDFWSSRAALAPLYPAGLDFIFTCGSQFICIPRTTKTTLEG